MIGMNSEPVPGAGWIFKNADLNG